MDLPHLDFLDLPALSDNAPGVRAGSAARAHHIPPPRRRYQYAPRRTSRSRARDAGLRHLQLATSRCRCIPLLPPRLFGIARSSRAGVGTVSVVFCLRAKNAGGSRRRMRYGTEVRRMGSGPRLSPFHYRSWSLADFICAARLFGCIYD
ncbi:hypothetical protein C8J57DRAFT_1710523 [Mycena rebaudengoi]|nr:hypothetical protein C8J57DRAFT_1710523 [Mycena rebaudengoi]